MKKLLLGSMLALSFSLLSCNDNSSSGPDKKEGGGIEVPCNAENEGEVVSPADSDKEYVCKDSAWTALDSSRHCEDCKDETIAISSSSSNNNAILSASDKSSSSVIASETKQSSSEQSTESSNSEDGDSSTSVETTEDESSSSEEVEESSSSEMTPQSSSENVEESSSSEEIVESSSSEINTVSSSSLNSIYDATNNTLTDLRDGQVYKTVTIGTQVWMAQNLNYLPEDTVGTIWAGKSVCGGGEWRSLEEGDCSVYGRLYESSFTNKENYKKEICPTGWSLPTQRQYESLISFLGDDAGNKLKIDNPIYWSINESTNQSGFSAIPAGDWSNNTGFNHYEQNGDIAVASFAMVEYTKNALKIKDDKYLLITYGANQYIAVRCIKKN